MIKNTQDFKPLNDWTDKSQTIFNESSRSMYAITAEVGDYQRRLVEDGTSAFGQLVHAQTVQDALGVLGAFNKRTSEEYAQHMHRLASMFAEAARQQTLAMQALMSGHNLAA